MVSIYRAYPFRNRSSISATIIILKLKEKRENIRAAYFSWDTLYNSIKIPSAFTEISPSFHILIFRFVLHALLSCLHPIQSRHE